MRATPFKRKGKDRAGMILSRLGHWRAGAGQQYRLECVRQTHRLIEFESVHLGPPGSNARMIVQYVENFLFGH